MPYAARGMHLWWQGSALNSTCLVCFRRFRDAAPEDIEALTLEGMRQAIAAQLHAGNLEINIVGDFNPAQLENLVLRYLGTVRPVPDAPARVEPPIAINFPPAEQRRQVWHLKDSDERAIAMVAGTLLLPILGRNVPHPIIANAGLQHRLCMGQEGSRHDGQIAWRDAAVYVHGSSQATVSDLSRIGRQSTLHLCLRQRQSRLSHSLGTETRREGLQTCCKASEAVTRNGQVLT